MIIVNYVSNDLRKFVAGSGPTPAPFMLIGEAPGREEDETGLPFVGRSGKLLVSALMNAGIYREEVYITNTYKYRPPDNRKPTREEIESHSAFLHSELRLAEPKIIVLLGNTALEAFSGFKMTGVTKYRGTELGLYPPAKVFATFHPSAGLRSPTYKKLLYEDLQEIAKLLT